MSRISIPEVDSDWSDGFRTPGGEDLHGENGGIVHGFFLPSYNEELQPFLQ